MAPEAMLALRAPSGRRRTLPVSLTTYSLRTRSPWRRFRRDPIEHHLGQAFAIADVEKDDPAVVTAAVDPTAEGDFLAVPALVQLAAIVAAHHGRGFASLEQAECVEAPGRKTGRSTEREILYHPSRFYRSRHAARRANTG